MGKSRDDVHQVKQHEGEIRKLKLLEYSFWVAVGFVDELQAKDPWRKCPLRLRGGGGLPAGKQAAEFEFG